MLYIKPCCAAHTVMLYLSCFNCIWTKLWCDDYFQPLSQF